MDGTALVRIGAAAFVGLAATVTAIEMTDRDAAPPSLPVLADHAPVSTDPIHRLLVRCQRLGAAATRDPICLKTWADNRRRFLGADLPANDEESVVLSLPDDPIRKEAMPMIPTQGGDR